jgi:hypothetical protein
MLGRLLRFLRRRDDRVYVLLNYEGGGSTYLGPMDRLTADIFLIHRLGQNPSYGQRRVVSARLVLP